jgi:hypothetical protein
MRFGKIVKFGSLAALAAVAALVGGMLSLRSASAVAPTVTIDPLHAGPAEVAKVDLRALNLVDPGLGALTVDVHYNPGQLTAGGCAAEHGGICNPAFSANVVRVVGTAVPGIAGDTLLASLEFVCKQPGESNLELSIDVFADSTPGDPREMDVTLQNATAVCSEEALPTPTPEPTVPPAGKLLGDVDCDQDVDTIDAVLVLQYSAGLLDGLECMTNADVNEDSSVDALDAIIILQIAAGLLD